MVVEELVEGGLTRLAAFYYSDIPGNVGPIRSMRASDIDVVSPVHATMVTSGAAPRTISRDQGRAHPVLRRGLEGDVPLDRAVRAVQPVRPPQRGRRDRQGQGRDAAELLPVGRRQGPAEGPEDQHDPAPSSPGATPPSGSTRTARYHNLNSNAPAGDQFPADNVLVLRVREGNAGYLDPAGNPVPKTLLTGKGNALLFHGGRMVAANWKKGNAPALADHLDHEEGSEARGARRPHLGRAGAGRRREHRLQEVAGSGSPVSCCPGRTARAGRTG